MGATKGSVPWNAGTSQGWTDKRGYRWLYVDENGKRRARREHRVLVERSLGRRLEPWEVVHHVNGKTDDNRLENLEVIEFGKHTAEHSRERRHSEDARRSMEAFALMREELKSERVIKADLLEACRAALRSFEMAHACTHSKVKQPRYKGQETDNWCACDTIRAAIAKASP